MLGLNQPTQCVQLVVDDGLTQVISLKTEPSRSPRLVALIHSLLMGPDGLESLLQDRLTGLCHTQDHSLHRDLSLEL